jgi:hypothetical protein
LIETTNFVTKDITVLLKDVPHLTYRLMYVLYMKNFLQT